MHTRVWHWTRLIAGCGALALALTGLHLSSDGLPGPAGEVYRNSLDRDLPVYAYVYTDVGVKAFLGENGRYGGSSSDTAGAALGAGGGTPTAAPDTLPTGVDQERDFVPTVP